ncbi:intelectin-like [Aplochiton taeniatus]
MRPWEVLLLLSTLLSLHWVSGHDVEVNVNVDMDKDCTRNTVKACPARSCKELLEKFKINKDGIYTLTSGSGIVYQTFCDMTTAGGGWTLVASVHENNMYGKCTVGDRWSSQQGSDQNQPEGDGNWANRNTFGTAEGATSDDFKNPGYFDIEAQDVSVWHVPNNSPTAEWRSAAILRYHTEEKFLTSKGGNLYGLFQRFPIKFGVVTCPTDHGPSVPIVYDFGSKDSSRNFYGPNSRGELEPGFISFRAVNRERAAAAICSGIRPIGVMLLVDQGKGV